MMQTMYYIVDISIRNNDMYAIALIGKATNAHISNLN